MTPDSVGPGGQWRLQSITISHFRGVAGVRTYEFQGRAAMLHGNNGVGKSTVAVALQWILFGRFHGDVLANVKMDSFLSPVEQAKSKAYSGEVIFVRGSEQLSVRRDAGTKEFKVCLGNATWEDEEAEAKLNAILGLDMETFVRAVLLQQSRLRGLLLDEAKERNRAIDRLLGMDAAEHLLAVLRPKDFAQAAEAWREAVREDEAALKTEEKLLTDQLTQVQDAARELKFLNKELNTTGLEARYASLGHDLLELGKKYHVSVEPLLACTSLGGVKAASNAVSKALSTIRLGAELRNRLTPLDKQHSVLSGLIDQSTAAFAERDKSVSALKEFQEHHGDRRTLEVGRAEAQKQVQELRDALKAEHALRQLLDDAHKFVEGLQPKDCPVCEQALPPAGNLAARLYERAAEMTSAGASGTQSELAKATARVDRIDKLALQLGDLEKNHAAAFGTVTRLCEKAAQALSTAGLADNKLLSRLQEAFSALQTQRTELMAAVGVMETDLEALDARERAVKAGLVPVIQKREELARLEDRAKAAKVRHKISEDRAAEMDALSSQIEAIKKALLGAKQGVANELLEKAAPRAQQIYSRLVRQPVFDTLNIQANTKAAKVDYTFEVSTKGSSGTAREARLVLSDGQLTATALALFFGLAESSGHALDLLYVDDPTQNLDMPCKEALAKVVAELAQRRQIVVSTQDEDFVTFLKGEGFPEDAVIHHITGWDGNPSVKTTVPSGTA